MENLVELFAILNLDEIDNILLNCILVLSYGVEKIASNNVGISHLLNSLLLLAHFHFGN